MSWAEQFAETAKFRTPTTIILQAGHQAQHGGVRLHGLKSWQKWHPQKWQDDKWSDQW